MFHRAVRVVLLLAAALLARPGSAVAQRTAAADRLVDSVGINIHLHYNNTPYRDQFPVIKSRLIELGIRHVRDGLVDTTWRPYFDRHNELGEAGIKGTFITAPDQSVSLWASYPARMIRTFEVYEAPNELDLLGRRPDWVPALIDTLKRMRTLKSDPRVAHFPIYGPSLGRASGYAALGDVSEYYDFANLHNYFGGRHPSTKGWGPQGHGSIIWHLGMAAKYGAAKPIVTTETGYQDSPSVENSVPQDVASRYLPILLLEQFRAGIVRTFLYELCDYPKSGSYGLLNQDVSPKPGFTAVKSLLNLLADRGPEHTPTNLQYSVRDDIGDARHLSFQKRDGTYFLALWLARPSYNPTTRKTMAVEVQRLALTVPSTLRAVRTHEWQVDGSLSTTPWSMAEGTMSVSVADRLVVIELAQKAPSGGSR